MAGTETLAELRCRAADAALPGARGTGTAAADGRPRAGRRGRALARWAALLGLLALAGQAAAPGPLAVAARHLSSASVSVPVMSRSPRGPADTRRVAGPGAPAGEGPHTDGGPLARRPPSAVVRATHPPRPLPRPCEGSRPRCQSP